MVKAPRSKGCRVCVTRRIKCDLTRPTCNRCAKAHRECPGYDDIKIIDEGPSVKDLYNVSEDPDTTNLGDGSDSDNEDTKVNIGRQDAKGKGVHYGTFSVASSSVVSEHSPPPFGSTLIDDPLSPITDINWDQGAFERRAMIAILSPSTYQEQLLASFIASVRNEHSGRASACHSHWLGQVARRNRQSAPLIWAIRAISVWHLGKQANDESLRITSRRIYGKALVRLSEALQDREEGLSSDTLSATLLLSFFEIFECSEEAAWIKHAGGAGHLIQLRGPDRHRKGLGRDVFTACRYSLIFESFRSRQACFLEQPRWRALCWEICNYEPTCPIARAAENHFQQMVGFPRFTRDAFNAIEAHSGDVMQLQRLHDTGAQARMRFKESHAQLQNLLVERGRAPTQVPSAYPDPVFPVVYQFSNINDAGLHIGFWAMSCMINMCLLGLEMEMRRSPSSPPPPLLQTQSPPLLQPDWSSMSNINVGEVDVDRRPSGASSLQGINLDMAESTLDPDLDSPDLAKFSETLPFPEMTTDDPGFHTVEVEDTTPALPSIAEPPPQPLRPSTVPPGPLEQILLSSGLITLRPSSPNMSSPQSLQTKTRDSPMKHHPFMQETQHLSGEICRATAYMSRAPFMGPFFLVLALRAALRFVMGWQERKWILGRLDVLGKEKMGYAKMVGEEYRMKYADAEAVS